MPLRDASHHRRISGLPIAASVPAQFWSAPVPPDFTVATSPTVPLEVCLNHGRWVVECPDCHSAQLACDDDRRFMCCECANVAVGNLWRPIVWPSNRGAIEAVVSTRRSENQNWLPGQRVEDLEMEDPIRLGGKR